MFKRRNIFLSFLLIMLLPLFVMTSCFSNKNNKKTTDDIPNSYTITINQTTGGKISTSKTKAQAGERIILSYTLDKGYTFSCYIVKDLDNNDIEINENSFIMPAKNVKVSGSFSKLSTEKYMISIVESNYGDILYDTDIIDEAFEGMVYGGSNISLTFVNYNSDNYRFASWNVLDSNNNIIEVNNNKFIMPNSNVTISVNVEEIFYTITVDESILNKCSIEVSVNNSDDNTKCHYNDYVYVSITVNSGVTFKNWNIFNGEKNISSNNVNYSFQVRKGNVTISAELEAKSYAIELIRNSDCKSLRILDSNGNNITQFSDMTSAKTGDLLQVQFEPNNNYNFKELYIQEYSISSVTGAYRFGNLIEYDEDYKFIMPASNIRVSLSLEFVSDNYYTITYDLDDDVINPTDNPTGFFSGDGYVVIQNPIKEGYNFYQWIDKNNNNYYYDYIDSKEIGENIVLKAEWYPIVYNIEFNPNGGLGNMDLIQYVSYDETIKLTKNTFTKDYYDFIGWSLKEDGEILYLDEANVKNLTTTDYETVTLYANWKPTTYTITYVDDNDTTTLDYTYFDKINIKTSSKEGYTFDYYEVNVADGNWTLNNHYNYEDSLKNMYGNPTLKANYRINQYTVTFVLDNGNDNIIIKDDYGHTFDKPNNPIKAGCEFIGWDKDIPDTIPASDLTITALYKEKKFNIYYYDQNNNEFSGLHNDNYPVNFKYNEKTLLDSPTKLGYIFDGYYKDSECNGTSISFLQTETSDVNLYAKWTPITYCVTYRSMSQSNDYNQIFTYDVKANLKENEFTHNLFDFAGWTTQINQDTNVDAIEYHDKEEVINLTSVQGEEIVLHAVWQPKTFKITLVDDNDNFIDEIVYKKPVYPNKITIPSDVKEGYSLDYWMVIEGEYHGIDFDHNNGGASIYYDYYANTENNKVPAGSLYNAWGTATLKGYFTINQYTITIKDGDDVIYTTSLDYKSTIDKNALEEETTKIGYDFISYDIEIPNNMPAENIILNTNWTAQVYDIVYKLVGDLELTDVTFENYPTTHTYNETTKLVFPTKSGFDAVGWYINSLGTGAEYSELKENTIVGTNGIITLYISFTQSIFITNNAGRITGLTDYGKTLSHLIIPEYINGVKITYVAGDSFENDLNLTMLTITSDLNFQSSALGGCYNLVEVINLTSINDSLFRNSANPWYISHDENYVSRVVKYSNGISYYIDDNDMVAVLYDGNSNTVTLDDNCNKIRAYAFYNANMQEINIPESVVEINECAFYDCDELLTFTFHDKLTSLGRNVLSNCDKLTTIYYNIPYLKHTYSTGNNHIIYSCPLLANIIIGDNVTVISHDLFAYNSSFESITIPKSVEKIEAGAFEGCGLSTVIFEVGSNISKIESAFMGTFKLYTVYLTNDFLYKNVDGQEAHGYMIAYAKNIYVLKSVYENENNTNSYFTNETKFIQPTTTVLVDGNEYYLFQKI